jgi:hypothetical protein
LGFFQPSNNAVVCNGENANIEGSATFANQLADPVEAVVSRAKKCGSLSFIFLRVEQFDESLKPVESGDLPKFIDGFLRQFESKLSSFGLFDGIPCDVLKVFFKALFLGSTQGEIFE